MTTGRRAIEMSCDSATGRDPGEIEITPEMIEAGLAEYALFDSQDPGEHVVSAIYNAMRQVYYLRSGRRIP
jgi:hypothetical protein